MQSAVKYTVVGLLCVLYALPAIGHPVQQPGVEIQDEVAEKIRELVSSIGVSVTKENAVGNLKEMFDNELEYIRIMERNLGETPEFAAKSCNQIAAVRPCNEPGYYWVQGTAGVVGVYCEFNTEFAYGQPGGWTRVANVNMTEPDSECPEGLEMLTQPRSRRICRKTIATAGCSSTTFSTYGLEYKKVCGKVIGYQYYQTDAFNPYRANQQLTIDDVYVDGVSITYGCNPRQHIWTFAAALSEDDRSSTIRYICPCSNTRVSYDWAIPRYVGSDYFCETGNRASYVNNPNYLVDDPLWDGKGCGPESTCCDGAGKPWFCKDLPEPSTDDIEVRLCASEGRSSEDVAIEIVELYIQ